MATEHEDRSGLESLGTPSEIRTPQPPIEPAATPAPRDWQANKKHGVAGVFQSIAYGVQFLLLSIYASADEPREADPIEKLRHKYGRPPRKF